jgi:S1-C subfamily serine protease
MIDTGSPFGFVLPISFVDRIRDSSKTKSRGAMAEWPFTSTEYNYLVRIEHFTLGTLELQNIPVLLAELPANLSSPLIGKEFLSQFLVTLDYPANELILLPYNDEQFRNNLFSTGLALMKNEKKRTVVRGLWEGSPADKAGIQVGNEVLEINSKSTKDLSLREIDEILEDDAVETIELMVRFGETESGIILKKEMLFPVID